MSNNPEGQMQVITLEEFKNKLLSQTGYTGYVKNVGYASTQWAPMGYVQLLDIRWEAKRRIEAKRRKDEERKKSPFGVEPDATRVINPKYDIARLDSEMREYQHTLSAITKEVNKAYQTVQCLARFQRSVGAGQNRQAKDDQSQDKGSVPQREGRPNPNPINRKESDWGGPLKFLNAHSPIPAALSMAQNRTDGYLDNALEVARKSENASSVKMMGRDVSFKTAGRLSKFTKIGGNMLCLLSFVLVGADIIDKGHVETKHIWDVAFATLGLVCVGVVALATTAAAGTALAAAGAAAATVGTVLAAVFVIGELASYVFNGGKSMSETISGWTGGNNIIYDF